MADEKTTAAPFTLTPNTTAAAKPSLQKPLAPPKLKENTIRQKIENIDKLEKRVSTLEADYSALKSLVDEMRKFFP